MEHVLTRSGCACVHTWIEILERYIELTGLCGAEALRPLVEKIEEDISSGRQWPLPADEKIQSLLVALGGNADFHTWTRLANLACSVHTSPLALAPSPSAKNKHADPRNRTIWMGILQIMEKNPRVAAEWAAGSAHDAALFRLIDGLQTLAEPAWLVLRIVSALSTMLRALTATDSPNARKGICSLQSAQGIWKRKPSYPAKAQRPPLYGAAREAREGLTGVVVGVLVIGVALSLAAFSKRQ